MIDLDKLEQLARTTIIGDAGARTEFAVHAMDPEGILSLVTGLRTLRSAELMVLDFIAALLTNDKEAAGAATVRMTGYAWNHEHPNSPGSAVRTCPKCCKNLPANAYCKGFDCPLNPSQTKGGM